MNKRFFGAAAGAALLVGTIAPVAAHSDGEKKERFFESQYRHDVMEHFSYSMKKLLPILNKGMGPKEHIPAIANIMASTATMTKSAFEKDTRGMEGHTETKDNVWENWQDFAKRMDDMERDTAAFAEITARTTDMTKITAGFKNVARHCKACHDEYKAD